MTVRARLIDKDCGVSYSGTVMMSHEDKYAVLFVCDDASEKTFYVDGETYASLHEDDYGTLVYVGDTFLGFDLGQGEEED